MLIQKKKIGKQVKKRIGFVIRYLLYKLYRVARYCFRHFPIPSNVRDFLRKIIWKLIPPFFVSKIISKNLVLNRFDDYRVIWRRDNLGVCLKLISQESSKSLYIKYIFTLPFLSTGGAELVTMNFINAIAEKHKDNNILLLITDVDKYECNYDLPSNLIIINLPKLFPSLNLADKEIVIFDLINTLRPSIIHNINSDAMWNLIIEEGDKIRRLSRIYANIFAFQYDSHGNKIGYAEYYLRSSLPNVQGIISDNKRFVADAIYEYNLEEEKNKFFTIYTPSRSVNRNAINYARLRLNNLPKRIRNSQKINCVWAGRIDNEKRIDLLYDLIENCSFANFDMYGHSVVDNIIDIPKLSNLYYRGGFNTPEDLFLRNEYCCFIFTSKWEGMPNILIETGCWGVPIVAPLVGGVGELVNQDTGYPLPEKPTVHDYMNALESIIEKPEEASRRGNNMLDLLIQRHSWGKFIDSINELPDYLC